MTGSLTHEARVEALLDEIGGPAAGWGGALARVPRHLFVPAQAWRVGRGGGARIDRDADPAGWWEAVYSDDAIITQSDDGASEPGEGIPSSALSSLSGVLWLLGELDVQDGDRLLEVGTGTGYTAALACERLGEARVVTVEVDPAVAKGAAACLEAAGYAPDLVIGDAGATRPDGGLFDRVSVTCAVTSIPFLWVEQTRPGGRIVAPYSPWWGHRHAVVLDVLRDGTAIGRFPGGIGYMLMRSHRPASGGPRAWTDALAEASVSLTAVNPRVVAAAPAGADLAISALMPEVKGFEDQEALWLLDGNGPGGSWARASFVPSGDRFEVRQAGDRRLWDEAEAAYFQWAGWGRPGRDRFGLTVSPDGQWIWLDVPDRILSAGAW